MEEEGRGRGIRGGHDFHKDNREINCILN
jgi:hypothetical protein